MTKSRFLSYLNDKFGTNINERFNKLQEEFFELYDLMQAERENDNYTVEHCKEFVKNFKDELSDINVIVFHLAGILKTSQNKLLEQAEKKIKGREKDPNYMRTHPHIIK